MHILSPMQANQEPWVGPGYLPYLISDNSTYKNPDFVRVFGSLAIQAYNKGNMDRYGAIRWMIDNLAEGGVAAQPSKITTAVNSSAPSLAIWYYMASDPNYVANSDPHANLAPDYFDSGLGMVLSRTDWTTNSSWFTFKSSWNTIDHQHGDGNGIGFYRNGEWLTKGLAGYGAHVGCSPYLNTLAVDNPGSSSYGTYQDELAVGSQHSPDNTALPVNSLHSFGGGYTFVQSDITSLYNLASISATDVAHASRSVVYLKPDVVVSLERVGSKTAGHYKRTYLNLPVQPTMNGASAGIATSKQNFAVDALLPLNATLTATAIGSVNNEIAAMEPMTYNLCFEDTTKPQTCLFLNVLQGFDLGGTKLPVSLVQSDSGSSYVGAVVGTSVVMFPTDITVSMTGVMFTVPGATTATYVTGLTPNAGYTVTVTPNGATTQISVMPGGAKSADAGGVIKI
jgi:hypothetical protein